MRETCDTLANLKQRMAGVTLEDKSRVWNTDWITAIELGYQLDVAEAMAHSAIAREESRGAHQRIDGFEQRDDARFLRHSLAHYQDGGPPTISYGPVKITHLPPAQRAYGALGEQADAAARATAGNKDVAHV
jgi:fumarate reductase flavoprotein subunit